MSETEIIYPHVFTLPVWQRAWRQVFGAPPQLDSELITRDGQVLGQAMLDLSGPQARFSGSPDICDYLDFPIVPGREREFYEKLLEYLAGRGVTSLDLQCLRPESSVLTALADLVRGRGGNVSVEPDGVSVELELPSDWDGYLARLSGRQRHEVRRKLRRINEAAEVDLVVLTDPEVIAGRLDEFLTMFRDSRADKAVFMNPRMESFFRTMIPALAAEGLFKLFVLNLDGRASAAALCFDYHDTVFLYNSAYDPGQSDLGAGLICKILSLKHSVEAGRKKYDFLRGAEPYKQRLGGAPVELFRCRIDLR